jgi:Dolichyl-phosphate-mannose-protein mannosyltransferase
VPPRYLLIVILVLAAALRCAYLPADPYPYDQSLPHGEVARNILDHGRWFVLNDRAIALVSALRVQRREPIDPATVDFRAVDAKPVWQAQVAEVVGPSLVLAGVWKVTGSERYLYGEIVQILFDLLAVLLIYRIALRLFKRQRTALLAALLYAIFPPVARQAAIFAPDIWGADFTIATVAVYLEAIASTDRWRLPIACGLVIGVGVYFRPNILVIPIVLVLAGAHWIGWRKPLRVVAVAVGAAALLMAPWTVRNYVEFHRFIPTRTGAGATLWQGLGEIHNNFGAHEADQATIAQVHRVHPNFLAESPEFDAYLGHLAVPAIEHHPLFYLRVVARRVVLSTVALYDSAWMLAGAESPVAYRARTGGGLLSYVVHRPLDLLQSGLESAVFILAMLALALTWRGRAYQHTLLLGVLLSALAPYWILHVEARYVLPAAFLYLMWIALGADLLYERVSDWRLARRSASVSSRELGDRARANPATLRLEPRATAGR